MNAIICGWSRLRRRICVWWSYLWAHREPSTHLHTFVSHIKCGKKKSKNDREKCVCSESLKNCDDSELMGIYLGITLENTLSNNLNTFWGRAGTWTRSAHTMCVHYFEIVRNPMFSMRLSFWLCSGLVCSCSGSRTCQRHSLFYHRCNCSHTHSEMCHCCAKPLCVPAAYMVTVAPAFLFLFHHGHTACHDKRNYFEIGWEIHLTECVAPNEHILSTTHLFTYSHSYRHSSFHSILMPHGA